jgi:hypothetical protein
MEPGGQGSKACLTLAGPARPCHMSRVFPLIFYAIFSDVNTSAGLHRFTIVIKKDIKNIHAVKIYCNLRTKLCTLL